MSLNPSLEKDRIFNTAAEIADPSQRAAFLERACGSDAQLRAEMEELLRHDADAGSFLEKPPPGLTRAVRPGEFESAAGSGDASSLEFLRSCSKPGCLGMLAHYEVLELVGRGGMGLVLRALDPKLNRVVAIKVMAPELAANAMAVKRFLREAQAAAAVSHDHVVTIHAIHEENRPPFIVMEYVGGLSLQQKIDRTGALGVKEILRIGMQTAEGLAAAHRQGLVHRDIKPANILLENGVERVKITDFGLARAVDDAGVTQTGQIAGTPQFMSPEQALGQQLDTRSDLFSLGSVFYAMCTGRPPFRADNAIATLRRVTDDTPRPIREINPDIPDWLEAIIFKLLAKEPGERFQTPEEIAELLSRYLAHLQNPDQVPPPPPVVRTPRLVVEDELSFIETSQRIYAVIALIWALLAIPFGVIVLAFPGNYRATFFQLNAPAALATGILSLITSFLAFLGTRHVERRASFSVALTGVIASLVPVNPPLVFALPWSVVSLLKLLRPMVRLAFQDQATVAEYPTSTFTVGKSKPPVEWWEGAVDPSPARIFRRIAIGLGVVLVVGFVLGAIYYRATDRGTLVIEAADEDVEILITRPRSDTHDGMQVKVVDRVRGSKTIALQSGHYRLLLMQGPDIDERDRNHQFVLSKEQFVLQRGGTVLVRVMPTSTAALLRLKLKLIPAGSFAMGTRTDELEVIPADQDWFFSEFVSERRQAETPQHRVTISKAFYLGVHEVTVGQFGHFIQDSGYMTSAERNRRGYGWQNGKWLEGEDFSWRNPGFMQSDRHPVCNVSWDDATAFCRWLSEKEKATYRLPTEAEWEYACRAGTATTFSTGNDPDTLQGAANLADESLRRQAPAITWSVSWDDGFAATAPIGSFAPNAFGLHDMHGNATEWCQDIYDGKWYENPPATDPVQRNPSGKNHIFRGGGFDNWLGFLRSADRYSSHSPRLRTEWAGFRVVREARE